LTPPNSGGTVSAFPFHFHAVTHMRIAIKIRTAPARTRSVAKRASRTATKIAPRCPFSKREYAHLLAEKKRLCDATPIGGFFISPITGLTQLKLEPITDEDVYAIY
jgi:hypothetical protein